MRKNTNNPKIKNLKPFKELLAFCCKVFLIFLVIVALSDKVLSESCFINIIIIIIIIIIIRVFIQDKHFNVLYIVINIRLIKKKNKISSKYEL